MSQVQHKCLVQKTKLSDLVEERVKDQITRKQLSKQLSNLFFFYLFVVASV